MISKEITNMNENLDQKIEELKLHYQEEPEDESDYIREYYVVQIAELREKREETIRVKRKELSEQLRNDIKELKERSE